MPEDALFSVGGFVLAGGASTRMGRDKALLSHRGVTLAERVAAEVAKAAGSVSLLGDPARYCHLGLRVVADLAPGKGPLSGLQAALHLGEAEWVLLVACDLANVEAAFLKRLLDAAPGNSCVAAESDRGLEPLCAVYHRSTRDEVDLGLAENRLRMRDLLGRIGATGIPVSPRLVRNVNTEDDWQLHLVEKERSTGS